MASRFHARTRKEDSKPAEASAIRGHPQALFKSRTVLIFGEVDMEDGRARDREPAGARAPRTRTRTSRS